MIRLTLCASVIAATVLGAPAARADSVSTTRAWANCQGVAGVWSELRISGCNAVISSGEAKGADLAKAHY